jgi:hypothetical protein
VQRKMRGSIGFRIHKVLDSYYLVDLADSVFTLILDSFHQNDSHKSRVKN